MRYSHIAAEDELNFDRLDASPVFGDLLNPVLAATTAVPAFNATLLNNTGVGMFNEKRHPEAFDYYQQALA